MELGVLAVLAAESVARDVRRLIPAMIGLVSGVASIILLMGWADGFRAYMKAELGRYGRGAIVVTPSLTSSGFPGYQRGQPVRFSREDAAAAENLGGGLFEAVIAEHVSARPFRVEGEGRVVRLHVSATDERYALYRMFEIADGRALERADVDWSRSVAVLGWRAAERLFGGARHAAGGWVRIEGKPFEVVGVARSKGRQYFNTERPDDELILIPATAGEARLGFDRDAVERLMVFPAAGAPAASAIHELAARLGPRAGFHPRDVDALRWNDTTRLLGLVDLFHFGFTVFVGVAGTLTLLISGIGIANFQLAGMAERVAELALIRVFGVSLDQLMAQVALEAALTAGVSAALGAVLGIGACLLLGWLAVEGIPAPRVSPTAVAVTAAAILAASALAAFIPARRVREIDISAALRS